MGSFGYTAVEENTGYRLKVVYGQGVPGQSGTQGPPGPAGQDGEDGAPIEVRLKEPDPNAPDDDKGILQWRVVGEEDWNKLLDVSKLIGAKGEMGPQGETGPPGDPGAAGDNPEVSTKDGYIVWRLQGEGEDDWRNLVEIITLKGDKGEPGIDGMHGQGLEIKGQVPNQASLPDSPELGDAWLIGSTVWIWGKPDQFTSADWIEVGDVTISAATLATLARKKELYYRQMRPGDTLSKFSQATAGEHTAGAEPSGVITESAQDGRVLRVTGQHVVATRERVALEDNRVYEVRAKARRVTNPSDPANDAITVHIRWLDEALSGIGALQIDMKELDEFTDDMLSTEIAVSSSTYTYGILGGCAQTEATDKLTAINPPSGARYAVPYIRVYGADSVTDIITVEMRDASRYGDFSRLALPPDYKLPQEVVPGPVVEQTIFVSDQGGDDGNNGKSMGCAVKTIERAMDIIAGQNDPYACEVLPGKYQTSGHIDVPDNCSGVVAATNSRSTKIVPSPGDEEKNQFRMGDGGYVEGFSFEGWQVDDLSEPSEGFAVSFRPGAVIRRSVFAFNITVYRPQPPGLIPPPVDPENGNPLVPKGPGVGLADKSVVSQYSPFPQLMLWGATPVCPNGVGYCAKNGGFLNGINAVALWMHKHYLALSGGEIILTNCASQFGDYSIWSDGYRMRPQADVTMVDLVVDTSAADAVLANKQNIINSMWNYLQNNGYGGVDEESTRRDAGLYLMAMEFDLRAGSQESMRWFVEGLYDYKGDFVGAPNAPVSAFTDAFDNMANQVKTVTGASGQLATMIDGLNQLVKDTLNSPTMILDPSKVTSVGHQWNNTFSGVNSRGFNRPNREVYDSIVERNFGTVTYSGVDDAGKQFFTGGALVNPLTGQFEGPPVDRTIMPRATRASIITSGY